MPKKQIIIEEGLYQNIYCHLNGSVSVGANVSAMGYKLAIKGKAVVTGATVALHGSWQDCVFEKKYKLIPLSTLKKFIIENGHLPDVPSAEAVSEHGIDVGSMSSLMLKKTEELTLYFIQLKDRLLKLEKSHPSK